LFHLCCHMFSFPHCIYLFFVSFVLSLPFSPFHTSTFICVPALCISPKSAGGRLHPEILFVLLLSVTWCCDPPEVLRPCDLRYIKSPTYAIPSYAISDARNFKTR
jgi:hypothetical protein